MTVHSYDYWRNLANCNVAWSGISPQAQAERSVLLDKIAAKCVELERKGEQASIWHAVHLVTGNPCHCARCNPKRSSGAP